MHWSLVSDIRIDGRRTSWLRTIHSKAQAGRKMTRSRVPAARKTTRSRAPVAPRMIHSRVLVKVVVAAAAEVP
jgi:hypothetical protein